MPNPTPEQEKIISVAREGQDNIFSRAYAGCAKSTSMEMAAHHVPEKAGLGIAFNVKIKDDLSKRFPSHIPVKTFNGIGHSAWQQAIGKRLTLEKLKLGKVVTEVAKNQGYDLPTEDWIAIRQLVTKAMTLGMVPSVFPQSKSLVMDSLESWMDIAQENWLEITPPLAQLAREALITSVKQSYQGLVSFDDQIYMSAMYSGSFPRFPLVILDEYQDVSPLNIIQIRRIAAGRLMVVGDPRQAIYGWRGADAAALEKLRALRPTWTDCPLTLTFRCPQLVVARQQQHAPGFSAFHTNPQGLVEDWSLGDPRTPNPKVPSQTDYWSWEKISHQAEGLGPNPSIAILCRNNAPLLSMAFKLIRRGIGCHMLGREIGKGLIALSKKIIPQDSTPISQCAGKISEWRESQISLEMARDSGEDKLDSIHDRAECLQAVIDASSPHDAGELRKNLESFFSRDSGLITLSTVHKAKGLEYDLVVALDPWRIPSRQALKAYEQGNPIPLEQEHNLTYVKETRTKNTLILADLGLFR